VGVILVGPMNSGTRDEFINRIVGALPSIR
jgi:hypothetical protein